MKNKQPFLSLCIPTNGKVEWMIPVIDSIYNQGVDNSLFEVVVADNGEKDDLQEAVKRYSYENFHYYRTNAKGFTNQIDAFENCSGLFCKMLNHRSKLIPGSINALISLIRKYQETKPILYCAEGNAKGGEYIECNNIDEFVSSLGYWTSWSAGTGVWREDISDIRSKTVDLYFPHTVFLFGLRENSKYVIWNGIYSLMADDAGKGGYDLFQTFGVGFLDIINTLRVNGRVSQDTFIKVKKEVLTFLNVLYLREVVLPTKHTFIIGNVRRSFCVYYSLSDYYCMLLKAWLKAPYNIISRCLKISISVLLRFFRSQI